MSNDDNEQKRKIPIEEIILNDWIVLAQNKIITQDEAKKYVEGGYITNHQYNRMFPKQ